MALVTTCPACQSSFFVKPEQLAAHRGDVRCGKCQHVFNALSALNQLDPSEASASANLANTKVSDVNQEVIAQTEALLSDTIQAEIQHVIEESTEHFDIGELPPDVQISETESSEIKPLDFETADPVPDSTGFVITQQDYASDDPLGDSAPQAEDPTADASETTGQSLDEPDTVAEDITDGDISTQANADADSAVEAETKTETEADSTESSINPATSEVSEIPASEATLASPSSPTSANETQPASEPKRINVGSSYTGTFADPVFIEDEFLTKRKVWLTPLLTLLFVLLSLSAAAQAIYFYRTEISARWPQTAPYLKQTCKVLHCSIPLPHDISAMVIDDSEIEEDKTHQGLMHLHTTLINTSNYAQRYPILELTLTDNEDHAKIRRPFQPNEYLPAGTAVATGMPAGEELHITLSITTDNEPLSGYRVFVHY